MGLSIAGHSLAEFTDDGYGRDAAPKLSRWSMRATRNADNYGYYALEALG